MKLGWNEHWAALADGQPGVPVRIVAEHRGAYEAAGDGGVAWCELTGLAYHVAEDKRDLPTVGDWVLVDGWDGALAGEGAATLRAVLPRTSLLVRKAAGEATIPQPLAANVDVGLVMTSANADLSPARLDRYLSMLRDAGIAAHILLSKCDLAVGTSAEDPENRQAPKPPSLATRDLLAEADSRAARGHRDVRDEDRNISSGAALGALGLGDDPGDARDPAFDVSELAALAPVTRVSAVSGEGIEAVRALVGPGRTAVLLGSSGVGKSTLLNALLGTAVQDTRPIRDDDRGRHTTTRRELFALPDGSLWIDTPGMRELGAWVEDEEEDVFEDIAELAAGCRFSDCKHLAEPGCAVRDAVDPARLASFHKLAGERAVGARKQEAARRIAETRKAKAKRYAPRPGKPGDES